jgi:hypothetical protein
LNNGENKRNYMTRIFKTITKEDRKGTKQFVVGNGLRFRNKKASDVAPTILQKLT